jgi:hypothetical protein
MLSDPKSRRFQVRQPSSLKVSVRFFVAINTESEEQTRLVDVSRAGARLTVGQEVEIGQPLRLSFEMPRLLRAYDSNEPLFEVWAIVRSVHGFLSTETGSIRYDIGVAFIGPHPPDGYLEQPEKRYDLKPTPSVQGLWQARELTSKRLF